MVDVTGACSVVGCVIGFCETDGRAGKSVVDIVTCVVASLSSSTHLARAGQSQIRVSLLKCKPGAQLNTS